MYDPLTGTASTGYGNVNNPDGYDAQSGVASIGWANRLDDPDYARRMASINDWNQRAAMGSMAKQQALQSEPATAQLQQEQGLMQNDKFQQSAQHMAAVRQLTNQFDPMKPVASSRYGNEFHMGGKQYDLTQNADPAFVGPMSPDNNADYLRKTGEQGAVTRRAAMRSGDFALGSKSHEMFSHPLFSTLTPEEQDHLSEMVTGAKYSDHIAADKHLGSGGGRLTMGELQQMRNLPARQKLEGAWADQWKQDYGVAPGEVLQNLNRATGVASLPARYVQNKGMDADQNPWVQAPPREIRLTPQQIGRLEQYDRVSNAWGLQTDGSAGQPQYDPMARYNELSARRNAPAAPMGPRPQLSPEQAARSRSSLANRNIPQGSVVDPQTRDYEARVAATQARAQAMAEAAAQRKADQEAMAHMQYLRNPIFPGSNVELAGP